MNMPMNTDDYQILLHDENIELLKTQPLFLGLSEDEIIKFITASKPVVLDMEPEHPILLAPGSEKRMGAIIEGSIKTFAIDYDGNRAVFNSLEKYCTVEPVISTLHYYNMAVEITAEVPSRVVLFEPKYLKETIAEIAAIQHKIIVNFMEYERRLFISISEHLLCLSQKSIRDKVLRFLFFRCEAEHTYEFDIQLSREEMADYLAVDRASLSRTLGELKREGVIDFKKNHFKILDTKHFKY